MDHCDIFYKKFSFFVKDEDISCIFAPHLKI